jgi:hypothetical protein
MKLVIFVHSKKRTKKLADTSGLLGSLFFKHIYLFMERFYLLKAWPLAICIGCVIMTSCSQKEKAADTQQRLEYYENGNVKRQVKLINGKKEGQFTEFYPDGKIKGQRWFINDLENGRTLLYHRNGKIKEVQYYAEGKKQGGDTLWYDTGQIEFIAYFQNDLKHGNLRKWSPEGNLIYEAEFYQDSLVAVKSRPIVK